MSKLLTMRSAIAELVPDGSSVALGLQMEQMIPFAAGHELIRQKKRGLTLIGPISDVLFDQLIGAEFENGRCVERVIAAWVGNVMMGSAYNFRRAVESGKLKITDMSNFSVALALQAAAMGVPFLPTRTALGSDVARDNEFFAELESPFPCGDGSSTRPAGSETRPHTGVSRSETRPHTSEKLLAVKALAPDVAIVHVQRADAEGNAHCWGNFGVMLEGVRAAKRVILVVEKVVEREVISSDPNRTVIPGFLVNAVVECPYGAHPSPVQGCYSRDDAAFQQYHQQTKTPADFDAWLKRWVLDVVDRREYMNLVGACRQQELSVKKHAYAAEADFGY
ncbi:MAG: CoA transferase subunit A [Terriglobales bacterium]